MSRYTVMTAIPYVNGRPHMGHALELVQADVLARHRRQRGDEVRFQTGTDDNALKNVHSAEAEPASPPASYVAQVAERFAGLREPLACRSTTSSAPAPTRGTGPAWSGCGRPAPHGGDLYRKAYSGLYCVGCEQFYAPDELSPTAAARSTATPPEPVEEENWFFRLSATRTAARPDHAPTGCGSSRPPGKREVLAFIEAGLAGLQRLPQRRPRAPGLGHPGAGRPGAGHLRLVRRAGQLHHRARATAPTTSGSTAGGATAERVHVIGKGIIRFHAVYWPAMLLSAGVALPDAIFVHEYLTVDGAKLSKSAGNAIDPVDVGRPVRQDALRWWMLSELPGPATPTSPRPPGRAGQRGPGQQPRQPGQPHGLDAAPLPRRRGARPHRPGRTDARPGRRGRRDRRRAGGFRLPAGGRGGDGDR